MNKIELHPLCTLFPRLTGEAFDTLRDDIATNGLREPIVTHEGMILDGGNRYRACVAAGIKPTFVKFGGDNLVSFVLSANLHRRHMSPGQQAAIVASAQDWANAQVAGSNQHKAKAGGPATVPDHASTVATRAAASGASERTQRMADKVAKKSPELAGRVARGEISLPKAAKQIDPPKSKAIKSTKPAKDAPTIESLQAENEVLRGELTEAQDVARMLAHELESFESATAGEKAAAKELTRLKGQLNTVESQRDQWMTTCSELRKEVRALQRKLKVAQ